MVAFSVTWAVHVAWAEDAMSQISVVVSAAGGLESIVVQVLYCVKVAVGPDVLKMAWWNKLC